MSVAQLHVCVVWVNKETSSFMYEILQGDLIEEVGLKPSSRVCMTSPCHVLETPHDPDGAKNCTINVDKN